MKKKRNKQVKGTNTHNKKWGQADMRNMKSAYDKAYEDYKDLTLGQCNTLKPSLSGSALIALERLIEFKELEQERDKKDRNPTGEYAYSCPHCQFALKGNYGEDVYCPDCKISYETIWTFEDLDNDDTKLSRLSGVEKERHT